MIPLRRALSRVSRRLGLRRVGLRQHPGLAAIPSQSNRPEQYSEPRTYEPPIIICGIPRSGTTFVGQLINSVAAIAIAEEFPLHRFPAITPLFEQHAAVFDSKREGWRGLRPADIADRRAALMVELWKSHCSAGWHSRYDPSAVRVHGVKCPRAELDFRFYESVFDRSPPRYVYCVRHPEAVVRSQFRMRWRREDTIEHLKCLYGWSLTAFNEIEAAFPDRVTAVALDRVDPTAEARAARAQDLFEFLGLRPDEGAERFIAEWRTINQAKAGETQGVTEAQLHDLLHDQAVRAFMGRFGYS